MMFVEMGRTRICSATLELASAWKYSSLDSLKVRTLTRTHLVTLSHSFLFTAAAAAWNPALEPLDDKISKYLGGNPVRIDGRPRASGIFDTVRLLSNTHSDPTSLTVYEDQVCYSARHTCAKRVQ